MMNKVVMHRWCFIWDWFAVR